MKHSFVLPFAIVSSLVTVVTAAGKTAGNTLFHDEVDSSCTSPETSLWGVEQNLENQQARVHFEKIRGYMNAVVYRLPDYEFARDKCLLQHEKCTYWAAMGECDANPNYMRTSCAPACGSCDQFLEYSKRCPFNRDENLWTTSGMVEQTFERLVNEYNATVLSKDPWVVTIDDFISEKDCQTLINWGRGLKFERSEDAGNILEDGRMDKVISNHRTSQNAWCLQGCATDPATLDITSRIEEMLEIPRKHYEYFQLLKYEVGEYYKRHHDFNPQELDRPQGNRILTAYIYLNDVEEGGGTLFNHLNLTVTPKRGRILIWPSVYDSNPLEKDPRMDHEAMPVLKGQKFGANIWIHQRDFAASFAKNCQ